MSGGFYNFSNIPFAEPPLGKLRFTAPIPPQGRSSTVNNGSIGAICPQAAPAWEAISVQFVPAYLAGLPFNLSAAEAEAAALSGDIPPQDPRTTEDCLTLDVFVPEKIFSKSTSGNSTGAPVMVWIYGGGYTTGFKDGSGLYNPAGLIKASQVGGSEGVIYVAPNYRVRLPTTIAIAMLIHVMYLAWCLWMASWTNSIFEWNSECCLVRSTFGVELGTR